MKPNKLNLNRILVIILAVSMTLASFTMSSFAEPAEGISWNLNAQGVLTISGTGAMDEYAEGQAPWLKDPSAIKSVVIEDGITKISSWAFAKCRNLTSVTMADSVTQIGGDTFNGCTSLASIKLSDHINMIPYETFINCKALASIEIPDSVVVIDACAFEHCNSLTEVVVPDSVQVIGQSAFWNCLNLEKVTLGSGVEGLGEDNFRDNPKLKSINVDADNKYYASVDGVLYDKDIVKLIAFPAANTQTEFTVPLSVTRIEDDAFWGAGIQKIYFSGDAPSFERDSFYNVEAVAYYPSKYSFWANAIKDTYGAKSLTWTPYEAYSERKNIGDCEISLEYTEIEYKGGGFRPTVTIRDGIRTLAEGKSFNVEYANNYNVGTATVKIIGIGEYQGIAEKTFDIVKAHTSLNVYIDYPVVEVGDTPKLRVDNSTGNFRDITYSSVNESVATISTNGTITTVAPGKAVLKATAEEDEHFVEQVYEVELTVTEVQEPPYDINDCTVKLMNKPEYNSPLATFQIYRGMKLLNSVTDYKVTYENAENAGTATATITGLGNYAGTSRTYDYEIQKSGQSVQATITPGEIRVGETAQVNFTSGYGDIMSYRSLDPKIATVDENGVVTAVSVGTTRIEATRDGDNNHKSASHSPQIKVVAGDVPGKINIAACDIDVKATTHYYDGQQYKPAVVVKYGNTTLVEDQDYTLQYNGGINAGSATVTVIGKGEYTGSQESLSYFISKAYQTVEITPASQLKLNTGDTAKLEVSAFGDVSFESSDEDVATVDEEGNVVAIGTGTTTLWVYAEGDNNHHGSSGFISVAVSEGNVPEKIRQNQQYSTVTAGVGGGAMIGMIADLQSSDTLYFNSRDSVAFVDGDMDGHLKISATLAASSSVDDIYVNAIADKDVPAGSYKFIVYTHYDTFGDGPKDVFIKGYGTFVVTEKIDEHKNAEHTAAVAATCTSTGNSEYWYCPDCKKYYSDASCTNEIEENSWIIPREAHQYNCEVATEEYLKSVADCTHAAVYYKSCSCGAKGTETFANGNELGHDWDDGQVTTEPTYTEKGEKTYHCSRCEETKKEEVAMLEDEEPVHEHTTVNSLTRATFSAAGKIDEVCSDCGETVSTTVIAKPVATLSKTAYTYNGKVQTPTVYVKDTDGRSLIRNTDYTLSSWSSGRKNVGTYKITITLKGKYSGTKTLSYKINPKKATIKTPYRSKTYVKVKWSKQSSKMSTKRITGYQVQIAKDKKFTKSVKSYKVKGYKKTSKKITKLKRKTQYYVRVRTYLGSYYSGWSSVKAVKTK